jgi:hypothetical protein
MHENDRRGVLEALGESRAPTPRLYAAKSWADLPEGIRCELGEPEPAPAAPPLAAKKAAKGKRTRRGA